MNLTIAKKLAGLGLIGVLLVVMVGGTGYWGLNAVDREMDNAVIITSAVRSHGDVDMMHEGLLASVLGALVATESGTASQGQRAEALDELAERVRTMRSSLAANEARDLDDDVERALAAAAPAVDQYISLAERTVALAFENRPAALEAYGEFSMSFSRLEVELEEVSNLLETHAGEAQQRGDASVIAGNRLILWIGTLALVLMASFSTVIARGITRALNLAVSVANRIAEGDMTVRFSADAKDETGRMLRALKAMVERLGHVIGEVREGAGGVSSAAQQVSASAQTMSQGTTEQAASVEETSASLEQMNSSITQNTENSRQMETMALKGAKEAQESGEAVDETVKAMRSIAEKISIIEEIAYQTNLLALNAAIEAARAGEHGKGFAVVATEVRKLAERSQTAAKEIGGLASSSVQVAERAGTLLVELVPSITKTADLVQEVTAASTEQSGGVEQINQSMTQVDSVTQRNASAAEELSSTAEEMASQADTLSELISFFTLNGRGSGEGGRSGLTALAARGQQESVPGKRQGNGGTTDGDSYSGKSRVLGPERHLGEVPEAQHEFTRF